MVSQDRSTVTDTDFEDICDLVVYDKQGLVPVIVQDIEGGTVLMMAWMDETALRRSIATGQTWFWSRSRQEYWHKGATSGNTQQLLELCVDCDGDALLARVEAAGPACHTGQVSCFYRGIRLLGSSDDASEDDDVSTKGM
jgi:phosphoribosyl-AMP cyclohydrolase / phosphoribosyl-ATP pyrophosphohydrolase